MKKDAFTLAEVLITLGIIGVVAAMTLPIITNKISDKQNIAALKKSYSIISQAAENVVREYGSFANLCETGDTDCLRNIFMSYLKTVKVCDKGDLSGNCWSKNGEWKRLNGRDAWLMDNQAGFILSDGTFVGLKYTSAECDNQDGSTDMPASVLTCGSVSVDVNGFKKPNVICRDIFFFYILPNKLIPYGAEGTWTGSHRDYMCGGGGDGESCTMEYLSGVKATFKY